MTTKFTFTLLTALLWIFGTVSLQEKKESYPAPRYPKPTLVSKVEDLLPNARHVVTRKRPSTGNQFPGYQVKGGEKVLLVVYQYMDPWVTEAFARAFREQNCWVDVIILQGPNRLWDSTLPLELAVRGKTKEVAWDPDALVWIGRIIKEQKYDFAVSPSYLSETYVLRTAYGYDYETQWPTREMLADPAIQYPREIIEALDRKSWEKIRQADKVQITDPEGTDLQLTYSEEQWQVIEGTHPTFKATGRRIGPGMSEIPQISGHLMGVPMQIVGDADARGVISGTGDHAGPYPFLKITMEGSRVTKLEEGGAYGDLWREYLAKAQDIRYPHYPGKGVGWLIEGSIGTHPKIARPFNVLESMAARSAWPYDRNRTGIIHVGIGQRDDIEWAEARGLPFAHFHVHLYFPTYRATLRDGRPVVVIDRGHLTALDDPEVRQIAARHGNPDQLLREDWIPGIPGINMPGDYQRDYASDPASWFRQHYRQVYGEYLRQKNYP